MVYTTVMFVKVKGQREKKETKRRVNVTGSLTDFWPENNEKSST